MFDGIYINWNHAKIKAIIDFYGAKNFYFKNVLDLGCGYGDIGTAFSRLGADVLCVDARREHLNILKKKYPHLKNKQADLDYEWPFAGKKFDFILDLGIICHLQNWENHIAQICASTTNLVLETEVCDSTDPEKKFLVEENKTVYDWSFNGVGSRVSDSAIEKELTKNGFSFIRMDNKKLNSGPYQYDWTVQETGERKFGYRRIWFAKKSRSVQQAPVLPAPGTISSDAENIIPNNENVVISSEELNASKLQSFKAKKQQQSTSSVGPQHNSVNNYVSTYKNSNVLHKQFPEKHRFVIVIPSYNNIKWCEKNINSVINQDYENYRVIFTDDNSTDGTYGIVRHIVGNSKKSHKFTTISNIKRIGALANLYSMIHSCDDNEIILTLDGDDWFPNDQVLNKLNEIYSSYDVWMTYGQYQNYPDGGIGVAKEYPQEVIDGSSFRKSEWRASHLRTFYAWLFKSIKREDLCYDNSFFTMTWDFGIMFPMLEMAGSHSKFISDILYTYNLENPINDHKVNVRMQQDLDRYIRNLPMYQRRENPLKNETKIGLLLIATGKYDKFIQGLITSADKYFLNKYNVTYYVFSDKSQLINTNRKIVNIPIEHKTFPYATLDRFKHFSNNENKFVDENYLYYVDVDSLFVNDVCEEVFGNLVGVQHCGYFNAQGPIETNIKSVFYVNDMYPKKYKNYFGGGFSGGKKDSYLELCKWCYSMIEQDLANEIMPIWHDETALNRYFLDHEPSVILSPSFHYPSKEIAHYKKIWNPFDFSPRILLLDKNHQEIRK